MWNFVYTWIFCLSFVHAQDQSVYKVWLESFYPCEDNSNAIADMSGLKISHFNRTSFSIDGAAKMFQDLDKEHYMRLVGYVKSSHGKWTKTLLDTKNVLLCDFIKKDKVFWPGIVKISDLPKECPIKKGEYQMRDAAMTIDRLPPMLPLSCYKLVVSFWSASEPTVVSCNRFYVRVTDGKVASADRCFS
ncbi:uncharacterized protein LOC128995029 [Macrosteles quadrilineatus]|uniref:uncharacterized protein LOC128995029 n=1 Tax=Macrosteles quadrilineatus TaxID=74068 RepID=UPI0023E16011|nr:uncharacterized protein LOC128995029 [Macrosteles quadrilineatus]